jgi:hypothetical protein
MLQAAQMSHGFSREAITTTNYLQNKIITKVVAHCTPKEVWIDHKPTMKHLRTFRCSAYAHILSKLHKKLDVKSRKCQFLGCSNDVGGYCFLDVHSQKVFISRDVVFNENLPTLFSKHQIQTTPSPFHKPNLDTFIMGAHLIPLCPLLVSLLAHVAPFIPVVASIIPTPPIALVIPISPSIPSTNDVSFDNSKFSSGLPKILKPSQLYLNPLFTHNPDTNDSLIHLITISHIPFLSLLPNPSKYSPFGLSYQT